ncbi:hypothetical protein [Pedococcus bigeumensis]|uniref:hypothetical protein n=1 Tax=Pedococcus bigeumensis TaxID=433644 RepID=UPI002FE71501
MSGLAERITAQVRKDLSHHMVYPPGVPLALGDIVEKSGGIWVPIGNIAKDLGITLETTEDESAGDWESTSERGYDIQVKLAGQPAPAFKFLADAEAGIKLTLKGENAFVLSMSKVRINRIASVDAFWNEVKGKRGFWNWDLSRRIVTRVVTSEATTFLASATADTAFEMSAKADVRAGVVSVADLSTELTLRSTMSARDRFVTDQAATPLFGAHRVKLLSHDLGMASTESERLDETGLTDADNDTGDE